MTITLVAMHNAEEFTPLALLYMKAWLVERCGIAEDGVRLLEFPLTADVSNIVEQVQATHPDVLGLSCYLWNVTALLEAAARVKAASPDCLIVVGGPEVGPQGNRILGRHPAVDVVVKAEGEVPLGQIVASRLQNSSLDQVPGLVVRSGGHIIDTPEATILGDLDELPSPHTSRYGAYEKRIICLETQRGCVFRCNFCFYNKDLSIRNRRFELDRVKDELRYWLDRDVSEIYLMDPVFNLKAARAKEICAFIAEHNHRHIPVHTEIWAEFVDDELAQLMKAAGFNYLEVGLQTTDTDVLATVERRLKLQAFLDGVAALKRHDLFFEVQLIYGLPGETTRSFRDALNFAFALDAPDLQAFPLMVLPGTELWRKADGLQLTFDEDPPHLALSHYSMSAAEMAQGRAIMRGVDLLSRSRTIRQLTREPGITFADFVMAWPAWAETHPDDTTDRQVRSLVEHMCHARGIPAAFYAAMAALEYQ